MSWWRVIRMRRRNMGRRASICSDFALVAGGILLLLGATQMAGGSAFVLGVAEFIIAGLMFAIAAYVYRGGSTAFAGQALVSMMALGALGLNVAGGGGVPGGVIAIPILMIMVLILVEGWSATLWLVVTGMQIPLAWYLNSLSVEYPLSVDAQMAEMAVYRVPLAMTLMAILIGLAYRRSMRRYRNEAERIARQWQRENRHAELEEARLRDFAEIAADVLWETDDKLRFTSLSRGFEQLFGIPVEECIGLTLSQVLERFSPTVSNADHIMEPLREHRQFDEQQVHWVDHDGEVLTLRNSGRPILMGETFVGYRGVMKDITDVVKLRHQLHLEASTDALTGLLNRFAFTRALGEALGQAAKSGEQGVGVAFLDLDDFKTINDTGGHEVGDEVLLCVADAISNTKVVSGRLGGDEFACFFLVQDPSEARQLGKRLLANIHSIRLLQGGQVFRVNGSLGLHFENPVTTKSADDWLCRADEAAYLAKNAGKGRLEMSGTH